MTSFFKRLLIALGLAEPEVEAEPIETEAVEVETTEQDLSKIYTEVAIFGHAIYDGFPINTEFECLQNLSKEHLDIMVKFNIFNAYIYGYSTEQALDNIRSLCVDKYGTVNLPTITSEEMLVKEMGSITVTYMDMVKRMDGLPVLSLKKCPVGYVWRCPKQEYINGMCMWLNKLFRVYSTKNETYDVKNYVVDQVVTEEMVPIDFETGSFPEMGSPAEESDGAIRIPRIEANFEEWASSQSISGTGSPSQLFDTDMQQKAFKALIYPLLTWHLVIPIDFNSFSFMPADMLDLSTKQPTDVPFFEAHVLNEGNFSTATVEPFNYTPPAQQAGLTTSTTEPWCPR